MKKFEEAMQAKTNELKQELKRECSHCFGLDEYQHEAIKTSVVTDITTIGIVEYCTFGIAEEAGEVAGKIKKEHRDDGGELTEERRQAIAYELGDVMWYVSVMASALDYSLEDIANMNLQKIRSRMERNQIHGDGDNR